VTFNTDISELISCNTIDSVDIIGNHVLLGSDVAGQKMTRVGNTNVYSFKANQIDNNTILNYKFRVWKKGIVYAEILPNLYRTVVVNATIDLTPVGFNRASNPAIVPAKSSVTFIVDFAGTNANPASVVSIKASGISTWLTGAVNNTKQMELVPNSNGQVYKLVQENICDGTLYFDFVNGTMDEKFDVTANTNCVINTSQDNYVRQYVRPAEPSTIYVKFGSCNAGTTALGFNAYAKNADFKMYPNPMVNSSSIVVGSGFYTVNLIDVNGKIIRSYTDVSGKLTIEKGELTSGIYIVDVQGANTRTMEKLSIN
jgi:hypothetical protein